LRVIKKKKDKARPAPYPKSETRESRLEIKHTKPGFRNPKGRRRSSRRRRLRHAYYPTRNPGPELEQLKFDTRKPGTRNPKPGRKEEITKEKGDTARLLPDPKYQTRKEKEDTARLPSTSN